MEPSRRAASATRPKPESRQWCDGEDRPEHRASLRGWCQRTAIALAERVDAVALRGVGRGERTGTDTNVPLPRCGQLVAAAIGVEIRITDRRQIELAGDARGEKEVKVLRAANATRGGVDVYPLVAVHHGGPRHVDAWPRKELHVAASGYAKCEHQWVAYARSRRIESCVERQIAN